MSFYNKIIATNLNSIEVYHGTVIYHDGEDPEDIDFHISDLQVGTGDLPALWVANAEETAEWFSRYHSSDEDNETYAVAKCRIEMQNPYVMEASDGHLIELEDGHGNLFEFHVVDDREELYSTLTGLGYDAFITKNNYGYDQDDIALLDSSCLKSIDAIKLSSDGKNWSEYLEPDNAQDLFIRMAGDEPELKSQIRPKF